MYTSQYYTCEEIDERLLKGYYDDAVDAGYSGTFQQFTEQLANIATKYAININHITDTDSAFSSKATARGNLPQVNRISGQIITYLYNSGATGETSRWITEQFIGSTWATTDDNWAATSSAIVGFMVSTDSLHIILTPTLADGTTGTPIELPGATEDNAGIMSAAMSTIVQSGHININALIGNYTAFASRAAAIQNIPNVCRVQLLTVTYLYNSGATGEETTARTEQFIGTTWGAEDSKWRVFRPVTVSQNTTTGKTSLQVGTNTPVEIANGDIVDDLYTNGYIDVTLTQDLNIASYTTTGETRATDGYFHSCVPFAVSGGETFKITARISGKNSSRRIVAMWDENDTWVRNDELCGAAMGADTTDVIWEEHEFVVPAGVAKIAITYSISYSHSAKVLSTEKNFYNKAETYSKTEADNKFAAKTEVVFNSDIEKRVNNWKTKVFTLSGTRIRSNGNVESASGYSSTDYLFVNGAKVFYIHSSNVPNSCVPALFYDENKTLITPAFNPEESGIHNFTIPVPSNAVYFRLSRYNSTPNNPYTYEIDALLGISALWITKASVVYLSINGDDNNDGLTEETPVKTLGRAKDIIADGGELIVLEGDYENLTLDLSDFPRISGHGKVRFIYYVKKFNSATLVDGKTRVYYAPYNKSITDVYLFQHDIEDAETAIGSTERHPLQRSRNYRMPSTRLYPASSINEIENTTNKLMWYSDGANVYFSKAEGSDLSVNPIILPSRSTIVCSNRKDISIKNLNVMYNNIELTNATGLLDNVKVGMRSAGGAIICSWCKAITLNNCEVYAVNSGDGGDGVNTHNYTSGAYDVRNDRSIITINNLWAHDCADDGESCHENCLTIHNGGLIEYNGAGVTPASDGATECNNVISRNNGLHDWTTTSDHTGTGFGIQGTSSCSMVCISCLAQNNAIGFRSLGGVFTAVNCVSNNDTQGYVNVTNKINCV